MIRVLCIKTVIMDNGEKAFTKDKEYTSSKRLIEGLQEDPYEAELVLRAKNDFGQQHIIKRLKEGEVNDFFNAHFKEVDVG